jgi:hypothetical protein
MKNPLLHFRVQVDKKVGCEPGVLGAAPPPPPANTAGVPSAFGVTVAYESFFKSPGTRSGGSLFWGVNGSFMDPSIGGSGIPNGLLSAPGVSGSTPDLVLCVRLMPPAAVLIICRGGGLKKLSRDCVGVRMTLSLVGVRTRRPL